ncbi:uncharacterized protein LOC127791060 isoform X2 [Diospyros lotus]|uniref:uncharacterized protein LOC127791060 isoform X2 n=1 Tax=Diospyros lotus TaxID=55363 RepID=UPI002257D039|nr:uncharacterized protein LOC127791060 isoform X2 [Diospyros lotus]
MLGGQRPPSNSLEFLELERSPSKIIKHDSLSVYEQAIMVDANFSSASHSLSEEATMAVDLDCTSTGISSSASNCQATSISEEPQRRTIPYLFARYMSSQSVLSSPDEALVTQNSFTSASGSPSYSSHKGFVKKKVINKNNWQVKMHITNPT